jgi:tRNA (cytidine/uridine-2'-O-)-methyltransferase
MRLALYQPDIPQNTGTILRMAACLGVGVEIIGPCGFDFSDRALRRAGLDYLDVAELQRHINFSAFDDWRRREGLRLVLATTQAERPYTELGYRQGDVLMLGRESAGVPEDVRRVADEEVRIPMREGMRSLNVALAGAMIIGEALRQTGGLVG